MQIRREGKSKVVKNCQIYPGPQRVNEQTKTKAPVVPLSDFLITKLTIICNFRYFVIKMNVICTSCLLMGHTNKTET